MEKIQHALHLIGEDDVPYEEELLRNPYNVKAWSRYLNRKADSPFTTRQMIYERALKELPASYKLWREHLEQFRRHVERGESTDHHAYSELNNCYERALVHLNKMPRIWLDYAQCLMRQGHIILTRRVLDRALQALPITQHVRVWEVYVKFVQECGCIQTAMRVFPRYLKLHPEKVEDYIDFLMQHKQYDDAVKLLVKSINSNTFTSARGRSVYQLWLQLCDIVCAHPTDIKSVRVDLVIRAGIRRFTDQVGRLWCALAKYYILMGDLEQARDVFEEALETVVTVRDFTQIFDAYVEYEEAVISARMSTEAESDDVDLDMRLARFEKLMDRRPFLINDVLLRQNPNNVMEWMKRVKLNEVDVDEVKSVYRKALETILPKKSHGRLQDMWIQYATFEEDLAAAENAESPDLTNARAIFEKSLDVFFKHPDSLAECFIAYADMELRYNNLQRVRQILGRGTSASSKHRQAHYKVDYFDDGMSVQQRVFKSTKLWSYFADFEEGLGTVETTRAVYDKMIELKIVTAQSIINYAIFLEDNKYFEDAFKVYERGVELFTYPIAFDIWNVYLEKFMKRYGGTKLERARDLFEDALKNCPPKFCKYIYVMFGKLEEDHGLVKRAMQVYDRAVTSVSDQDRFEMYNFYIARAINFFGLTYCRPIYEKAIEVLPDRFAKEMSIRYAEIELKLGEIDRARAIYAYASQFCDPRMHPGFWQKWQDFEVQHGNEETFKDMLRIKRSVQARYNDQVSLLSHQMLANRNMMAKPSETMIAGGTTFDGKPTEDGDVAVNPDEITIDDDEDDMHETTPANESNGIEA